MNFLSDSKDDKRIKLSWKKVTIRVKKKSFTLVENLLNKFAKISIDELNYVEILKEGGRNIENHVIQSRGEFTINYAQSCFSFFFSFFCYIMDQASGYVEVGSMVAIMGPSGAGKTTLLDTLAKKIIPTSGTIRINGIDVTPDIVTKISSYVPQFDPLPEILTVAEYIAFSCALRLDRMITIREREKLERDTLLHTGLYECKDSLIRELSGGEKKRLSLAAEIITKPRILFLDEPTTGLDTSSAFRVIESIKHVSTNGIILCSIHQPSMMIYKLFTHVIFLTEGRTAFFGTLEEARIFFESQGYQCPLGFDEAEYYLQIISNRIPENEEYSKISHFHKNEATSICEAYEASDFSKKFQLEEEIGNLIIEESEKGARWIVQFNWLLWRIYLENRRTFVDGLIAFQYYAISIILISIFFWDIDARKQRGIQDAMGVLFVASSEAIFSTAYTPLYEIEREIPLYKREASMYGPSAYYLATAISWIPKAVFKAFFLSFMLFIIIDTREIIFLTLLKFWISTIASCLCGTAYGCMIASFIEDNEIATTIMVPIDLLAMLTAGVYYSLRTFKWYTVGFKYLSIFFYTTEALSIAYWSQIDEIDCDDDASLPCVSTGSEVLFQYGYEKSNFWFDIMAMGVLTIFMNFIGYLGVRKRRSLK